MKTKKYLVAIAILGGMLFTAQATNIIDLNEQVKTEIEPTSPKGKKVMVPSAG